MVEKRWLIHLRCYNLCTCKYSYVTHAFSCQVFEGHQHSVTHSWLIAVLAPWVSAIPVRQGWVDVKRYRSLIPRSPYIILHCLIWIAVVNTIYTKHMYCFYILLFLLFTFYAGYMCCVRHIKSKSTPLYTYYTSLYWYWIKVNNFLTFR
jgi:hypothetical protein